MQVCGVVLLADNSTLLADNSFLLAQSFKFVFKFDIIGYYYL